MGRRPEPKSDKIARGTYRADRDKSMTIAVADEVPNPPGGLGEAGRQFWADAYGQPWVSVSDRTMVQLVARKLDEREQLCSESFSTAADQWRKHRTLKEIDRDVASGLDQLLLTPNSRQRAGIETVGPSREVPTTLELMQARRRGEISREEYELFMEPERARQAAELKEQAQREQLERISDASLNRIEALMNPGGIRPKLDDQD
ncbi:hypothetical protein N9D44_01740 [Pontimonas sp.]|nr:hypothetical protein [Pontimonas sp.]